MELACTSRKKSREFELPSLSSSRSLKRYILPLTSFHHFREVMGIFPGFGGWINQNTQQPPKAESKRSDNAKSKSRSEITHEERDEMKGQLKLWRHAEKKRQWEDVPPKVEVETENVHDLCYVDMVFTLGLPPQVAYDVLTNADNQPYSRIINERLELLENVSRKVLTNDGTRKTVEVEKALAWKFFLWSVTIPIRLEITESRRNLSILGKGKGK